MIHYRTIDSPIGLLTLAGRGSVLTNLRMVDQTYEPSHAGWAHDPAEFGDAVEQLNAYFAGELTDFDLEVAPTGTPFQVEVWSALSAIPYGTTCSYREIADQVGRPQASRAVGQANGRNPISVVIPCHRVVAAGGGLGGYGWGLDRKRWLLDHEARHLRTEGQLPV